MYKSPYQDILHHQNHKLSKSSSTQHLPTYKQAFPHVFKNQKLNHLSIHREALAKLKEVRRSRNSRKTYRSMQEYYEDVKDTVEQVIEEKASKNLILQELMNKRPKEASPARMRSNRASFMTELPVKKQPPKETAEDRRAKKWDDSYNKKFLIKF